MIKEGTDILRMRLSTLHIPSNAGRPHFQKAKAPKTRKGFKRQPEAFSSNTLIMCFISQPLISKSFLKNFVKRDYVV